MLTQLRDWLFGKPQKRIAFIDGDQDLDQCLRAYEKYVKDPNTETHLVRAMTVGHKPPKVLRTERTKDINKIFLQGYTAGKETVDKFIAGYIQKAVHDGYTHITVVSGDYDFIDIFKMAVMIDPHAAEVTFRMVVLSPRGRLAELPDQVANIEVVKTK